MLRGEVTQVPLDNMISWWQAIFQIAFRFWRNPGWHWDIQFYTPPYSKASCILSFWKNAILLIHVKLHSIFIWLSPLLKRIYKPGNTSLGLDHLCLWPFRRLQVIRFSTLCVSVSSTTHWFLYLHHNLFVLRNCLAQWGPQWEPQGISIARITNNRKEEQNKKHHQYKNRSRPHQTEEIQNSVLFKTGNRSKWEGPTLPFIQNCDVYLQRIMAHIVCIAPTVRTHWVTVQWNSRNCTLSGIVTTTNYLTFYFAVFFPVLMF